MKTRDTILFVNSASSATIFGLKSHFKKQGQKIKVAVIRDSRKRNWANRADNLGIDILITCDFESPSKLSRALNNYKDSLLAVTCRGEANVDYFRKLIPHLPYLKTPTSESLNWSTDKLMMREMLGAYNKKIIPKFTVVNDVSKKSIAQIKEKVGFPLVIKPAALAASLLVTVCYHKEELESNLNKAYKKITKIYKENGRKSNPKILVEEFMEGEMYSVDAYINSRGKAYFCPLVHFKNGRSVGFDDFFCYQRITPTTLSKTSIEAAQDVAIQSVHALGLRSTTAHIELIKTDAGWKVIELGPRIGGFRNEMYELSFGIDHSLNDVLIRIPKTPIIPKKIKGYTGALKMFAKKEGILTSVKGLKKCEELKSFVETKHYCKIGDRCKFAKHGGKGVFDIVLFNKNKSELLADIRRVEQTIVIVTE